MKRIIALLGIILIVILSGCGFFQEKEACAKEIKESSLSDGILIKTVCKENGMIYKGLINSNYDYIVPEIYYSISKGHTPIRYLNEDYVISDATYLRVKKTIDLDSEIGVIDKNGKELIMGQYDELLISGNKVYIEENGNAFLIDLETMEETVLEYRIFYATNDNLTMDDHPIYYVAFDKNEKVVIIDDSFNRIDFKPVDISHMFTKDFYFYVIDNTLFYYDFKTNTEKVVLENTKDISYQIEKNGKYLIINPNTHPTFIRVSDFETFEFETCTLFGKRETYRIMNCDDGYQVYDVETLETVVTIPASNTEFIGEDLVYLYQDDISTLNSLDKTIVLDEAVLRHEWYPGYFIFEFSEHKSFYDLDLNKLFDTGLYCEPITHPFDSDVFIINSGCDVSNQSKKIDVIQITSARFNVDDIKIMYYNDEFIYLSEDYNTILIDYEGNVLFD